LGNQTLLINLEVHRQVIYVIWIFGIHTRVQSCEILLCLTLAGLVVDDPKPYWLNTSTTSIFFVVVIPPQTIFSTINNIYLARTDLIFPDQSSHFTSPCDILHTMPAYILFGYEYSDFTARARKMLESGGIDYEFWPADAGVHPDGSHPLELTRVPALRDSKSPKLRLADGLEEIEQWLKSRES